MFNNLIESTSHAREFKRRGSFLLFTTATYLLLFVVTGVISIYAYDARLEEQSLEMVTLISPQDIVPQQDDAPALQPERPRGTANNTNAIPERAVPMVSVNNPQIAPDGISTTPNKNLPLPDHGPFAITGRDYNPGSPGGLPSPGGGRAVSPPRQVVIDDDPPPPLPEPPKPQKIKSIGVVTGLATSLPKPVYPEIAKRMRIQGMVSIQVLIDESGRVISAKALRGSPFLTAEAQKAALQARFSPTLLSNQPVKVSGIITYNFVLSN